MLVEKELTTLRGMWREVEVEVVWRHDKVWVSCVVMRVSVSSCTSLSGEMVSRACSLSVTYKVMSFREHSGGDIVVRSRNILGQC